ncbi:MAG TPA: MBL fold metallo-hydrolase, partial [Polyangiaceae bacterium]|nr:MBL fold metallo-hydrolase [Polyangiaceae bacterium]
MLTLAGCAGASVPPHRSASHRSALPAPACGAGVAVQVLGSGGPIPDDARASSSYLVWVEGRARVLVDAGGGVLPRFGASGASLRDLDAIAISHLHVDHVGGLASLLKGGYFSARRRPLPVIGPSGTDLFPSIDEFLQ